MKNKMTDLNNHLFEALERLNDEDLKGDALQEEIERAKSIKDISQQIIANASLGLKAEIARNEYMGGKFKMPELLGGGEEQK